MTEWIEIPHCEGYYANELGQIKGRSGKILRPKTDRQGYKQVMVVYDEIRIMKTVHKLVALAYHGEKPADTEIDHIDNDKSNNAPDNLRYISHQQNVDRREKSHLGRRTTNECHHIVFASSYYPYYRVKLMHHGKSFTKTYKTLEMALANRDRLLQEWANEKYSAT